VSKAAILRALIERKDLAFFMEAHNALSAKIAEESGFEALWASGLAISASMGLSDRNEASWTQVLEVVEFMVDHTDIPILLDGDTGFGNFNNVRRLVRKLSQRNVAGVCLEDKRFPKVNSFVGAGQSLVSVEEFCGKLRAAKDSQGNPDFCVVARTEALISGAGIEEALARAHAYHEAGADAILIHSKQVDGQEVLAFCRQWDRRAPVIIVPTMYYKTPTELFRDAGVSCVIWANHSLRAAISAIRHVTRSIQKQESVAHIEHQIASLDDVFHLTNEFEVQAAELKYQGQARSGIGGEQPYMPARAPLSDRLAGE
jgi:phosphoenolpyruvate phosphomutase